jgi:hypothetical protein
MVAADFNHDGRDELAVATDAGFGGVLVYRGRDTGLTREPVRAVGPGRGLPTTGGAFPTDLAVGDLDGNGYPDLAAGWQELDFARGAVAVFYSSSRRMLDRSGSRLPKPQLWTQDSPGVKGVARRLDAFGSSVGVADVTGDGRKDLVVGVFQEPTAVDNVTGAVQVLRGTRQGVTARGDQYLRYDKVIANPLGSMASQMAVGDVNADGVADIAVTHGTVAERAEGAVSVFAGRAGGLAERKPQTFSQATQGIVGPHPPEGDYWGLSLVIHDTGRTRVRDLIVADPYDQVGGKDAGRVNVLWGSARGLSGTRSRAVSQDSAGVPGVANHWDRFGGGL